MFFDHCFDLAAQRYNTNATLLRSIADVESRHKPNAINKNKSSEDVGVMQINSVWFPILLKKYGISRDMLLNDPCLNIHIGAWILSQNIQRLGNNWNAVGAYNAGDIEKKKVYVAKVWKEYQARQVSSFVQQKNHTQNFHAAYKKARTIVITSENTHGLNSSN